MMPDQTQLDERALRAEIARLNKIIQALMNRAERNASVQGSDFNLFQTAITLEAQVRRRTEELEAARLENEKITRALRESENQLRLLIENAPVSIHEIGLDGRLISMSRAGLLMHDLEAEGEVRGTSYLDGVSAADRERIEKLLAEACAGKASHFEFTASGPRGRIFKSCFVPINNKQGRVEKLMGITEDITKRHEAEQKVRGYVAELTRTNSELKNLNAKLVQMQSQLLQSEKMASIGMLAAGVAHEINNPIGYIKSNMQSLDKYIDDLLGVLNAYEQVEVKLPEHQEVFLELHKLKDRNGYEYEKQDILELLSESRQGLERVTKIVLDLKDFSRVESMDKWSMEDIQQGIESTLNVISHELKCSCEVRKEYVPLPPVECVLPLLNQVFMNLLVNAAQAIETKGIVTIRTGTAGDNVWMEIADTGKGIPPENLKLIFDPFFTTKPVGKGTGLGLSVSYSIIQRHHGRIEVESTEGKGSTFRVWLPIRQPVGNGVDAA
ncbi:MAG: ATP-binding protein [Gallionella sp.]